MKKTDFITPEYPQLGINVLTVHFWVYYEDEKNLSFLNLLVFW